jgi:S-adenosylmethionine:tRNA ribosyltransferase-isomerase
VLVSDFNYFLPPGLIAQEPLADRAASRLLGVSRATGELSDRGFREFPELLRPGDLLVLNDSRVFPARLYGRRGGERLGLAGPPNPAAREFARGQVEVLLTERVAEEPDEWECLVRPGRKIGIGERLLFGDAGELEAEVVARGSFGERRIRFRPVADFFARLDRLGHVPLPPYISRLDLLADRERYQTVYAREPGSVAAPTAGLHFSRDILSRLEARGIETAQITLHVGLGTFQPVRVERVEDHKLHREICQISSPAAAAINRALDAGRRVVAVGTTSARTLEYFAAHSANGTVQPGTLEADIFIYPGYRFRVVRALLTNFHLPQSTLLMLVCAFGGKQHVLDAYRYAVEHAYRFYSYGDCMFLE